MSAFSICLKWNIAVFAKLIRMRFLLWLSMSWTYQKTDQSSCFKSCRGAKHFYWLTHLLLSSGLMGFRHQENEHLFTQGRLHRIEKWDQKYFQISSWIHEWSIINNWFKSNFPSFSSVKCSSSLWQLSTFLLWLTQSTLPRPLSTHSE